MHQLEFLCIAQNETWTLNLKRKQDFQREAAKDIAQEVFANQVRIEPSKCRFHMTVTWKSMLGPKARIATTQAAIGHAHQDGKLRIVRHG